MRRKRREWEAEDVMGGWRRFRVNSWLRRNSAPIKRRERRAERREAKNELRGR